MPRRRGVLSFVVLTTVLLVMALAGVAVAADAPPQPTVFQHWSMWPKAGHQAQFEEAIKAHVAWRKSAGEGFAWDAYQPVVGDDLTVYAFRAGPFHWKDLDAQEAWGVKAGALARWNEQVAAHVERVEHYLFVLDTEHSLWHDSPDYRYFGVTSLRLRPGAGDSMVDALKRIHKVAKERAWKPGYSVQWVVGGRNADFEVVNPFRSYAEMADPETPFVKMVTESLGSEQAAKALMTQFWSSFEPGHYMIVAHRPDLSTQK
jgi:hypothetical protein